MRTLLIAGGANLAEAITQAEIGVACLFRAIRSLGLEIATHKTEAIVFTNKVRNPHINNQLSLRAGNALVPITTNMKYLEIQIDRL